MESTSAVHGNRRTVRKVTDNNNGSEGKKMKKRRRRKKSKGKTGMNDTTGDRGVVTPEVVLKRDDDSWRQSTPVLRPVQVPNAPENSTQFIMDDHESSNLFVNFSTPQHDNREGLVLEEMGDVTPGQAREWYPFDQADFESAYQTAREDRMMSISRGELKAAIVSLEARASVLADALASSPTRLLARLQAQLLHLQEENKALKTSVQRRQQCLLQQQLSSSSSSTDSDSESDSTDSSTNCSESDCETCVARCQKNIREEEKENTKPTLTYISGTYSPALNPL